MAKIFDFDKFVRDFTGTFNDLDGAYGAQCVDGFWVYCRELGIPRISGDAHDFWDSRHTNGILNYFSEAATPQNGDVCVWCDGGFGHVAMYYRGQYFGQNQWASPQEAAAHSRTGGPFNLMGLNAPTGYLRPKGVRIKSTGAGSVPVSSLWMNIINGIVVECRVINE